MGQLVYTAITSLDGFIEDAEGSFAWAEPDPEVHAFANELERTIGTHLYGRRMYETMAVWETVGTDGGDVHPVEVDYAEVWRGLDKVVFSTTLPEVWTSRTRLERTFDPAGVARLKAETDGDLSVSGPGLAQHAFAAGLVDEVHLLVNPVIVGAGKPGLPAGVRLDLELVDEHRFANGVVHLHHRVRR
ncbi:MAG: dihydrofolate reductase family protein [Actinomycetota bacterium]